MDGPATLVREVCDLGAQAAEKIMSFYGKEAELTWKGDAFRIKGRRV